MARTFTCHRHV